jgi:S1-C subfamily serine protease
MALIPRSYLNCVVTLGTRSSKGEVSWMGTGTLVGRLFQTGSNGQKRYHIFIITNRHVLADQSDLVVRFNPSSGSTAQNYDIPLYRKNGDPLWKGHSNPEIDIAAIGIDAEFLEERGAPYSFFQSDEHFMPTQEMSTLGVSEGDFVYVLGFPMGIASKLRHYVIARSGCIARIQPALTGDDNDFLIDAMIFPGNSGGPVIYKPEIISIGGTSSVTKPGLIGIVAGYLTYSDTAISQQTGQARIVFEENSGLAIIHPVDFVMETIEDTFQSADIKEKINTAPASV